MLSCWQHLPNYLFGKRYTDAVKAKTASFMRVVLCGKAKKLENIKSITDDVPFHTTAQWPIEHHLSGLKLTI